MARYDGCPLDVRKVTALIHYGEAPIRQALAPQSRICRGHDLVVVAPDDECRHLDAVRPLLLKEGGVEHGKVRHRAEPWRIVGAAKAGMLRHQYFVARGQCIKERQPLRDAPSTVQEEDRLAATGPVQLDAHVPDFELHDV